MEYQGVRGCSGHSGSGISRVSVIEDVPAQAGWELEERGSRQRGKTMTGNLRHDVLCALKAGL